MPKMTTEELLRPRYMPIFNEKGKHYPNSPYKKDEVISTSPQVCFQDPRPFLNNYPNLFRSIQWWEHRDVSDMPEYVKYMHQDGKEPKFEYFICRQWQPIKDGWNFLNSKGLSYGGKYSFPATEAEYLTSQNLK